MPNQDDPKFDADTYAELVERWFVETFHGSVVARSTEVWNAVHAGKEDLKVRLADLIHRLEHPKP